MPTAANSNITTHYIHSQAKNNKQQFQTHHLYTDAQATTNNNHTIYKNRHNKQRNARQQTTHKQHNIYTRTKRANNTNHTIHMRRLKQQPSALRVIIFIYGQKQQTAT